MADKYEFQEKLEAVGRLFRRTITKEAFGFYWAIVAELPTDRVLRALDEAATSSKHMPTPAHLREALAVVSEGSLSEDDEWALKFEGWREDKRRRPEDYPDEEWVAAWRKHTEKTLGWKLDLGEPVKRTRGDEVP